jgi:hypothetical protein
LASKLVQIRLRVEQIALERATVHEQLDDTFGLGGVLRRTLGRCLQHVGQGQQAKPATSGLDYPAA